MVEPFVYFPASFAAAVLVGALCGLVGVYVVLRGMSYIGHGLSHAIVGWAVMSAAVNVNFTLGAGLGGFVSALAIDRVARRRAIGADAAIGVITTVLFAIGLAIISTKRSFTVNFDAALFGNILGVTPVDIALVAAVLIAAVAVVIVRYRALLFATFDPEVADVSGVRVSRVNMLFSLLLAATIVSTMQILGVLLVAAALVIPAATARMLTDSFARMLVLSTGLGALAGIAGMYGSYYLDLGSGASIVIVEGAMFVLAYVLGGTRVGRLAGADVDV